MNLKRGLVVFVALTGTFVLMQNFTSYKASDIIFTTDSEKGYIRDGDTCGNIGRGGNYRQGDLILQGKCEGGGITPRIGGSTGNKYIQFRSHNIDPKVLKDRSELAYTDSYIPFGKDNYTYIGFRMMIPKGANTSSAYFYAMQLWQNCPKMPPIAGLRLSKDNPYAINFMIRKEGDRMNEGNIAFKYNLAPGEWHSFVLRVHNYRSKDPSEDKGSLKLWADKKEIGTFRSPFGYGPNVACRGGGTAKDDQEYRLKFGIYKQTDLNKKYEVRFDDVKMGTDYHAVKPW